MASLQHLISRNKVIILVGSKVRILSKIAILKMGQQRPYSQLLDIIKLVILTKLFLILSYFLLLLNTLTRILDKIILRTMDLK